MAASAEALAEDHYEARRDRVGGDVPSNDLKDDSYAIRDAKELFGCRMMRLQLKNHLPRTARRIYVSCPAGEPLASGSKGTAVN